MWWRREPEATLLVLCTANICRSPAAGALLRAQLRSLGVGSRVRVLTAGTDAVPGMPPDPRMQALLREAGVGLRGQRSTVLGPSLLAAATAVYAMESEHLAAAQAVHPRPSGQTRELFNPRGEPVFDPYFRSLVEVRAVFAELAEAAEQRAVQWQRALRGG